MTDSANFGVLHQDDQGRRGNLTADDYEETYKDPGTSPGHGDEYPDGLIDTLAAQLEMKNG